MRARPGGCGTFFAISVESDKFKGLSKIKQHQLVNKVLEEEVKTWHGMQVRTCSSRTCRGGRTLNPSRTLRSSRHRLCRRRPLIDVTIDVYSARSNIANMIEILLSHVVPTLSRSMSRQPSFFCHPRSVTSSRAHGRCTFALLHEAPSAIAQHHLPQRSIISSGVLSPLRIPWTSCALPSPFRGLRCKPVFSATSDMQLISNHPIQLSAHSLRL